MKKIVSTLLAVTSLAIITAIPVMGQDASNIQAQAQVLSTKSATATMWINGTNVNLRSGPGSNYRSLGKLRNGEQVTAGEYRNGWIRVTNSSRGSGWVRSDYIGC